MNQDLDNVVGVPKTIWEKVTSGDWGFFRSWFKEAPLVPKLAGTGAALLTGGVLLAVGGVFVGGIVGGVKATIATLGVGNSLGLGAGMVTVMSHTLRGVEWGWNFNWAIPDSESKNASRRQKEFMSQLEKLLEKRWRALLLEGLGEQCLGQK